MLVLAMQTAAESGGQAGEIARTFGVDWPHLISQCISFAIVCGVLYALAYKPILRILETRRQQIAAGLANAEKIKAELARIESERQTVLTKAGDEGKPRSQLQRRLRLPIGRHDVDVPLGRMGRVPRVAGHLGHRASDHGVHTDIDLHEGSLGLRRR